MEICELSMRINQQRTCLFDILAFMLQIAQILFRRFRINGSFFVQFVLALTKKITWIDSRLYSIYQTVKQRKIDGRGYRDACTCKDNKIA